MRARGALLAVTVAGGLVAMAFVLASGPAGAAQAASPAGGSSASTTSVVPVKCAKVQPTVVFVGTVTTIVNDTVAFHVTSVKSGTGAAGTAVTVVYPTEYNARKLDLAGSYRVAATMTGGHLLSLVPTAQATACGQDTRHADGTAIDTASLAGVKAQLPHDAERIGIGVAAALVLLVLIGRVFDRRSRYR